MTYPPQQPQDPQFGQYGQQGQPGPQGPGPGQYGQPGSQGPGYPAQYPPQGGPYGGYPPQQPGNYGPPPQRNKTGLWVTLAIVVVALVALGITGFAAPGFFLSKDKSADTAAPPSGGLTPPILPSSRTTTSSSPSTEPSQSGTGILNGNDAIQQFISKLNAKDAEGAKALVCSSSVTSVTRDITKATSGTPNLVAGPAEPGTTANTVGSTITGTLNGQPLPGTGVVLAANRDGAGYCVTISTMFGLGS